MIREGHVDLQQESCARCGSVKLWQVTDGRGRPTHGPTCVAWVWEK